MNAPECLRCKTEMVRGVTVDRTDGRNFQAEWVEGEPESSFWTGLVVRDKARNAIRTYRCPACGYLESYATDKSKL